MFVTYNFATLLKTATGRVLSSVPRLFQTGTLFCSIFLLKVNAISLRARLLDTHPYPLCVQSPNTWKHARLFSPPSSANRFAGTEVSRAFICPNFSLSLSLPNVNKPWIFPSSSTAIRSIFNRPFPLHPHSSSYIFITRIISESKMFSRRIEWAAASAFSYTPVRVMFDGGREGRATRNQFQRNTLPTLLVVFMTDGCNGELIPWQSGGRHYTTE